MMIQIAVVIFCLFAISRIILRAKDKKLSWKETLLWILIFASIGVFVLMPKAMTIISKFAGVQRGVDLFIYISIIALFYLIFRLYIFVEKLEQDITIAIREVSLIKVIKPKKVNKFK